jgi:hypothetical protein
VTAGRADTDIPQGDKAQKDTFGLHLDGVENVVMQTALQE